MALNLKRIWCCPEVERTQFSCNEKVNEKKNVFNNSSDQEDLCKLCLVY